MERRQPLLLVLAAPVAVYRLQAVVAVELRRLRVVVGICVVPLSPLLRLLLVCDVLPAPALLLRAPPVLRCLVVVVLVVVILPAACEVERAAVRVMGSCAAPDAAAAVRIASAVSPRPAFHCAGSPRPPSLLKC